MKTPQHVEDSSSLAARERAEYYRELDRIEGISMDEEMDALNAIDQIPDSTERLLLKNYYSMIGGLSDDPFRNLLDPDYEEESLTSSLLDSYKW